MELSHEKIISFFQQPKFSLFHDLKTPIFVLQFVCSRFAIAKGPSLLEWAFIVSAELVVPLQWTWDMGKLFYFFSAVKIPLFSNSKTLKRHFSLFNLSAVDMPLLKAQACWSEPLLWVRNFLYHSSGLETWKNYFFSTVKIPLFSNPKTLKRHFLFFILSTVDLPLLKAQACWREPLLWVRNFLYHSSGVETWKNYFIFFSSQNSPFSQP